VKSLKYWHTHQVRAVLLNSVVGETFLILCGVFFPFFGFPFI